MLLSSSLKFSLDVLLAFPGNARLSDLASLKADLKELYVNWSEADLQTLNSLSELLDKQKESLRQLEEKLPR